MHADGEGLLLLAEQVRELGGTERLVQAVAERYPRARLVAADFATTNLPDGHSNPLLERAELVRVGDRRRHFLAPIYARRLSRVELPPAQLVLSFVHAGWAAALPVPPGTRHVSYTAGLPKSLYGGARIYMQDYPAVARPLVSAALPLLRRAHRRAMGRAERLLTNSRVSAEALRRVYGLDAEVVHPPVRTGFFTPAPAPKRHFLAVARVVGHKHLDLAVEAFRGLEQTLVVAGGGDHLDALRASAPPNVRFTGFVSDEELRDLYRGAHALVCPSVEEFGIVMAEAHACGVPVVAPRAGGALEIVDHGVTGLLVPAPTVQSLAAALIELPSRRLDAEACRRSALRFAEERFLAQIDRILAQEWELANDERRRRGALPGVAAAPLPGSPPPALVHATAPLPRPARP
jgi:glycosyltransferase involved in cell wall biosynthesis